MSKKTLSVYILLFTEKVHSKVSGLFSNFYQITHKNYFNKKVVLSIVSDFCYWKFLIKGHFLYQISLAFFFLMLKIIKMGRKSREIRPDSRIGLFSIERIRSDRKPGFFSCRANPAGFKAWILFLTIDTTKIFREDLRNIWVDL